MAAQIQKNEITASERQLDLIVYTDGAMTLADRGIDFIALGILYISDGIDPTNVPHYRLGIGTCVNKRKPLVVADDVVESTDTGANNVTLTAHGYETGDGPFTADETMGTIVSGGLFWTIKDDADKIGIASSLANAYSNTRETLSGTETGATISDRANTQRGIDGLFAYTFTQAETNVNLSELSVLIDGTGYARANNGGAYATAALVSAASDLWSIVSGDGLTNQQKLNLAARNAAAPFSKTGNDFVWRKLDDSDDSHSATVTAAGRSDVDIIDPD